MSNQSGQKKHPRSPEKQSAKSAVKKPKPNSETDVSPVDTLADDSCMDTGSSPAPVRVDTAIASNGASGTGAKQSLLRSGLDDLDSPPRWFVAFFQQFEQRIEKHIDSIADEMKLKLADQDEKVTACSIQISELEREVARLKDVSNNLEIKLDDLENRGRRNNLVFYGVPESSGSGKEVCADVLKEVLQDFVGLSAADFTVDRCHRTPTHRSPPSSAQSQDQSSKPRMIHAQFTSFADKEKVRTACIRKFKTTEFKGNKLFVSEDFSRRVLRLRKEKLDTFKQLKKDGRKPFFLFPAKLAYRLNTGKLQFVE